MRNIVIRLSAFAVVVTEKKMRVISLLMVMTSLSFAQPALGSTLRVLTYNIRHAEGLDSVSDLERIADVINSASPDVVALQKLDQGNGRSGFDVFQLDRLAELTGLQGYFGRTMDYMGGQYGNGVLVSPDITITSAANHPLPSPTGGEPRAVIEVGLSFDDMGSAVDFTLFATHFDYSSETNRLAQAGLINDLVMDSTSPALLAGDLNSRPPSSAMQRVLEQWTDTTDLVDSGLNRGSQIDYVLYRGADQWDVVEDGHFIVNATTQVASNHFPLLTVVKVVPEPSSFALAVLGILMLMATCFKRSAATH